MALKAEGAALDCFEVTLKCEEGEEEEEAVVVAVIPRPEPMLRVAHQEKTPPRRPSLLEAGGSSCEEPRQQGSWEQEFLVGSSPGGSGRTLCMVCGAEIRCPSADTARAHILEQHPHTLDLSPSEKSNILEAWSEGVALLQDVRAEQSSPPNSDLGQDAGADPDSAPDPDTMPAEIVVLLDSEDSTSRPRRTRPRGLRPLDLPASPPTEPVNKKPRGQRWREPPEEEPVRKKRSRPVTKNLDLDSDPDPDPDSDSPSPDSPTETFAAPPEVRHFTDGTFPPGFVLQLFSHTQPRTSHSKDAPREGTAAEGGLAQPESPSPVAGSVEVGRGQEATEDTKQCNSKYSAAQPPSEALRKMTQVPLRDFAGHWTCRSSAWTEEPPAGSPLQDWSRHPPGTQGVGAGDTPGQPAVPSEPCTTAPGQQEAGGGA